MKLIYLGHPYGGDEKNVDDAKQMVKRLVKKFPETVFLSPLQATGFYYNDIPYIQGMEHCLEMLSRCDALWLCDGWQESKGCCMEYAFAKAKGIPIIEVADDSLNTMIINAAERKAE
ncbi:MAG TPA: hypothetical protein DEB10_14805 [Ruminococcaceae bacterium]|nr:hypothetical protein [Oscillospiraceae bacterium]